MDTDFGMDVGQENGKKLVLVIDDNPDVLDIVSRTLDGSEFIVTGATDGRQGIQIAKEQKPDIILLDITMPDFNGFMIGKVIKRNQDTKEIPIIFISGRKTKGDITAAIQAGGSDYIVKPFSQSELLTRIRRIVVSNSINLARKDTNVKSAEKDSQTELRPINKKDDFQQLIKITMKNDVAVVKIDMKSIIIENCKVYRDTFANLIEEGKFRIVLNTWDVQDIDGAGLALLISTNESLKKYDGGLRLLIPPQEVINRFSFIKLNDLFPLFNNVSSAVQSFCEPNANKDESCYTDDMNICLSCTFVNAPNARYCGFCGTNLILGKGEEVLSVLNSLISSRILVEAKSDNIKNINQKRNFQVDGYEIPSEFAVEIMDSDLNLNYRSTHTEKHLFESNAIIGIQAPAIGKKFLPINKGMIVRLTNHKTNGHAKFDTNIDSIDTDRGVLYIHYNEDALALHSQKNFAVAPKNPFPVTFTVPTCQHAGILYHAQILELSRVRMVVFAEHELPLDRCMALNFILADKSIISSPLVIIQKSKQRYMYNVEFRIIDEKESTIITQYMYKRQIELAKGD